MKRYLREHEKFIKEKLLLEKAEYNWEELLKYHLLKIRFMQHERLIHLLVTLTFAVMLILTLFLGIAYPRIEVFLLLFLLFIMLSAYIIHYFVLENGVQRWYRLAEDLIKKTSKF